MAYNQVFLDPDFWKYQMFLWKEDLQDENEEIEMCIGTLIYGVKTAGAMTIATIQMLCEHAKENHTETTEGALLELPSLYLFSSYIRIFITSYS